MIEKDDWRLLAGDGERLKNACLNPADGEEIKRHAPWLKHCEFCLKPVSDSPYERWYLSIDLSCCVCRECFKDFKEVLNFKKLDGWDIEWKDR